MARRALVLLSLAALFGLAERSAQSASRPRVLQLFERLSTDLRLQRMTRAERTELEKELGRGRDPAVFASRVDRWMSKDVLERLIKDEFDIEPYQVEAYFLPLSIKDGVLFLPHTVKVAPDGTPCRPEDRVTVRGWWSKKPVTICAASYHPERTFDGSGYCAGQFCGKLPAPPREGCACGPALLACAPPKELEPDFQKRLLEGTQDEIAKTALDLILRDRPLDELLTTSRTWQSGIVEFLYLRRELLAFLVKNKVYSLELERSLLIQIDAIDLGAPGHWVERTGLYRGSGLFTTTPLKATTLRPTVEDVLTTFLCTEFHSVQVDSHTLLASVAAKHDNNGSLDLVSHSPMRTQYGCKGCHAPLDYAAGFLEGMKTPVFGSYPTGVAPNGKLYVKGAEDYRGEGVGPSDFAKLIAAQPEFPKCAAEEAFRLVMKRAPLRSERGFLTETAGEFEKGGRSWRALLRRMLTSRTYTKDALDNHPERSSL